MSRKTKNTNQLNPKGAFIYVGYSRPTPDKIFMRLDNNVIYRERCPPPNNVIDWQKTAKEALNFNKTPYDQPRVPRNCYFG
jgi:hypothetical protein